MDDFALNPSFSYQLQNYDFLNDDKNLDSDKLCEHKEDNSVSHSFVI